MLAILNLYTVFIVMHVIRRTRIISFLTDVIYTVIIFLAVGVLLPVLMGPLVVAALSQLAILLLLAPPVDSRVIQGDNNSSSSNKRVNSHPSQ